MSKTKKPETPRPQLAPGKADAQARAVLPELNAKFCAALPQEARGGHYTPAAGDGYEGQMFHVADGSYRVIGSDWIFSFRKGLLTSAVAVNRDRVFDTAAWTEIPAAN